jgi:hypothetical protein
MLKRALLLAILTVCGVGGHSVGDRTETAHASSAFFIDTDNFGPNQAIAVTGQITAVTGCANGNNDTFPRIVPAADVYIVPNSILTGSSPGPLLDAGNSPNTFQFLGTFLDQIIGFTAPTGAVGVDATPDVDGDGDGCTDAQEEASNELLGGSRDPANFWDYFDTPVGTWPRRDRRITIADVSGVVAQFGSVGDPTADPHSLPVPPAQCHVAFDRSPVGPESWRTGPPSGQVSIVDIGLVVRQFAHTCAF